MSYIGQIPATTFLQKQSQSFTPDGSTTSFSLDFSVTNEKDLLVVVNNVIQEPGSGKAYTASANTLLMSAAPASGDTMYCYYLGFTVGTINTPDGSVTKAKTNFITDTTSAGITSQGSGSQAGQIQLNCSANSHGIKLESPPHAVGQSYTLIYPENNVAAGTVLAVDSITGSGTTATGTMKFDKINAPAFSVSKSGQTTGQSDNTWTKITYDTENLDSDGKFASDRFTPTVSGKYYIEVNATGGTSSASSLTSLAIAIYKNGSAIDYTTNTHKAEQELEIMMQSTSIIVDLDTDDYVEAYLKIDFSTGTGRITTSQFSGYKLNV